jgi:hypothetical protein
MTRTQWFRKGGSLARSLLPPRREPMRRYKELGAKSTLKQSRSRFLRPAAQVIADRSGKLCEIQLSGCWMEAIEKSHRIAQGAGGRHGAAKVRSDRASNALHSCHWCHMVITRHGSDVDARGNGWVLVDGQEPTQVPVLYRGRRAYLDDLGGVWPEEEVCA